MDLATAPARLQALTASFNIWRLLAGYASQGPTAPIGMGQVVSSPDGLRTYCLLPGKCAKAAAFIQIGSYFAPSQLHSCIRCLS